jgi:DNA invertase Pin-like site-specific DNA recombinase
MGNVSTFAAYIRVSRVGGRDGDSFISPTVQRERIEVWAASHGHAIGPWYTDLDEPGSKIDRPEFQRALEACERGDVAGVVVTKLDRFARSVTATRSDASTRPAARLCRSPTRSTPRRRWADLPGR